MGNIPFNNHVALSTNSFEARLLSLHTHSLTHTLTHLHTHSTSSASSSEPLNPHIHRRKRSGNSHALPPRVTCGYILTRIPLGETGRRAMGPIVIQQWKIQ